MCFFTESVLWPHDEIRLHWPVLEIIQDHPLKYCVLLFPNLKTLYKREGGRKIMNDHVTILQWRWGSLHALAVTMDINQNVHILYIYIPIHILGFSHSKLIPVQGAHKECWSYWFNPYKFPLLPSHLLLRQVNMLQTVHPYPCTHIHACIIAPCVEACKPSLAHSLARHTAANVTLNPHLHYFTVA